MIDFNIDRTKTEGVNMDNIFFPSHFLGLICGWPGSGKTSLLKFMLGNPNLLYEKYDEILLLTPSPKEWLSLCLPSENVCDSLSIKFLDMHVANLNAKGKTITNVNFIILKTFRAKRNTLMF